MEVGVDLALQALEVGMSGLGVGRQRGQLLVGESLSEIGDGGHDGGLLGACYLDAGTAGGLQRV